MITKQKLKIYEHFGGDIDGWARCRKESDPMSDDDWHLIEELRLAIFTLANGNPANCYREQAEIKIRENTDSEETRQLLWEIGKQSK
jgi:hypothetical protein